MIPEIGPRPLLRRERQANAGNRARTGAGASVSACDALIALVAFLAGLSVAGPALAHLDMSARTIPAVAVERDDAASPARASGLGSELEIDWAPAPIFARPLSGPASATAASISWLALLAAGLAAVWLARRAPGAALAAVLIALLAVFAFENGLHSVHHGADKHQLASCPLVRRLEPSLGHRGRSDRLLRRRPARDRLEPTSPIPSSPLARADQRPPRALPTDLLR